MKYIDCDVKFYEPSNFPGEEDIANCYCFIGTLSYHNYILQMITDPRIRNKVLLVCHGASEVYDILYCKDFNYSVTSDVLLPFIQKYVKNVKVTPNGVEPSLYTRVDRSGELKVVGWAGASWIKCKQFEMFQPIVDGAGLLGKTTNPVIPVDKMDEWYQNVDILLVLSGPEESVETGPLPAFEAIACGIPVVGTRVGNFRHIPGPKFSTVEEGILLLEELKRDPERVREIAKQQYHALMTRWSYDVTARLWERALFGDPVGKNEFDGDA